MAGSIFRRVGAVLAGVVVAGVVVAVVEGAGHFAFPPPPGLDLTDPADQARLMKVVPVGAKLAVVTAWFLGALAGCWTALRIGRGAVAVWIVGGIMTILSLITTQTFPHPVWMVLAALAVGPLAALIVLRTAR
jgi:hypothetical protein